ncbi:MULTISPECIES: DUF6894 family protein [Bradyrhizobium]|jgi:hypothetical protein|uniref:DUF6894 family protein n=1 Tax=Bradyrhizobium TaxID=374 RepID=UPI0012FD3818|nr:tRNA 5-methylaminomethyl-2-thiouridine synthase [Bradyrhizobium elkanii]WLA78568.1 tRNA 5-methylaminomethyl-2-thiouridine synthase [Bradyrhizobium elkanii]
MATYYFVISGARPYDGRDGVPLRDDAAAWEEARSLMRDAEESLCPGDEWVLDVRREAERIFTIRVSSEKFPGV